MREEPDMPLLQAKEHQGHHGHPHMGQSLEWIPHGAPQRHRPGIHFLAQN